MNEKELFDSLAENCPNELKKHNEKVIDEFAKLLIDNLRDFGEGQNVIMAIDRWSILRLAKRMKEQRDGEN